MSPLPAIRPESVLFGRDPEALSLLLALHASPAPRILDVTHNEGRMWRGLPHRPLRSDLDASFPIDVAADFRRLPFAASSFDVLVFDPPHLPSAASSPRSLQGHCANYRRIYGLSPTDAAREGDNVNPLFLPFLREAARVLVPQGIVLAKIGDLVHNHRYQWQHVAFVFAARAAGMTPCDLLVKRDPAGGNLKSGRWQNVRHLKRCHCYWIVVRNGSCCERRSS